MFLKNAWYVIAWGEEVGRQILARTVCNESIILYRTAEGKVAALENACCHRQLPLAMGKLVGDNVQCGYHGLTFDPTGKCVRVPGESAVPLGSCACTAAWTTPRPSVAPPAAPSIQPTR